MIIREERIGPERWRGTPNGYTNHRCRCAACTAANSEYGRKSQQARKASITPNDPRHGTDTFYDSYGCRCEPCRKAHATRERERAARRKARKAA